MPYPSILNRDDLVKKARDMIERNGLEQFSMHKLAAEFGVKTPSLYRYFRNKAELIKAVNTETLQFLFEALLPELEQGETARERLMAVAAAYRQFVQANPVTYGIAFGNTSPEHQPDEDMPEANVQIFQNIIAELSGEENSLTATRGILAYMHGFISLELANQFRRGGSLDEAYFQAMQAYLDGWQRRG